jgi:hypothetical protein
LTGTPLFFWRSTSRVLGFMVFQHFNQSNWFLVILLDQIYWLNDFQYTDVTSIKLCFLDMTSCPFLSTVLNTSDFLCWWAQEKPVGWDSFQSDFPLINQCWYFPCLVCIHSRLFCWYPFGWVKVWQDVFVPLGLFERKITVNNQPYHLCSWAIYRKAMLNHQKVMGLVYDVKTTYHLVI